MNKFKDIFKDATVHIKILFLYISYNSRESIETDTGKFQLIIKLNWKLSEQRFCLITAHWKWLKLKNVKTHNEQ